MMRYVAASFAVHNTRKYRTIISIIKTTKLQNNFEIKLVQGLLINISRHIPFTKAVLGAFIN